VRAANADDGAAAASGSNIGAYSITSSVRASTPGGTSDLILSPASAELASFTKLYSRDTGEKTPPATLLPIGKWSAPSASLAPPPVRTRGTGVTPILILPTLFRPPVRPRRRGVGEGWRVTSPPLA